MFLTEMLACACGGTRRVIASIDVGQTARKILEHLGLPSPRRSRPLDQRELFQTGPAANDACEPPPAEHFDRRLPPPLAAA